MGLNHCLADCHHRVVKEEIAGDDAPLPNANGRVVCWVSMDEVKDKIKMKQ